MDLNSFLKLGFFLDKDNPDLKDKFRFNIDKDKYRGAALPDLLEVGKSKLLKSFENIFPQGKSHVIPLSGGLDSRAIIAFLLKFTEAKNLRTYTFGTPHSLDYEIGNYIAQKAGTTHLNIPLTNHTYTHDEMIEAAVQNKHATHLFHHPPVKLIDKYFGDCYTWSGFMGGSLPGTGLLEKPLPSMDEALTKFFIKNTYVDSVDITNKKLKDFHKYIDLPDYEESEITLTEQLNFFNRQKKYTYYHVKMCGQKMLFPFLEKDWADFILSIDNEYRTDKFFYKRMLYETFPKLFKLKTKTNGGLPLFPSIPRVYMHRVKRKLKYIAGNIFTKSRFSFPVWVNYLPFGTHIRNNSTFNRLMYESLNDLQERQIVEHINIQELYEQHMKDYKNYADALLVLASLEYHLKSGLDPVELTY